MKLKGIGVSFVDSEPKEVLYMSIYKIELNVEKVTDTDIHGTKTETDINIKVYHMQVDNQVPTKGRNKIIFGPQKEINFEAIDNEEDYTPFIQMKFITED